jgi:hypothetical protein
MKRAWWKLFIILIVGIMVCPGVNSFVFDEIKKNSVVQQSLIIPEYVTDWYIDNSGIKQDHETFSLDLRQDKSIVIKSHDLVQVDGNEKGPMDSPWSMFGHDVVHTCRSPYSTENNSGVEIWRVRGDSLGAVWGSALTDNNGLIYFGTKGSDGSLYALYPNGTRKWRFSAAADGLIWGTPAISEEGVIYVITWGGYHYFYALNLDDGM